MSDLSVTLIESEVVVEIVNRPIEITIPVGMMGPQGPAGPAGGSVVEYPAGQNLSAGRVVIIDTGEAFYFQPATIAHAGRAFGVTATSASIGNDVSIQVSGTIEDAGFSGFSDEALYVGTDGELQNTWPITGLLQKAGVAVGGNKVKIDFSIQIQQI
jgi:hypothetical protein